MIKKIVCIIVLIILLIVISQTITFFSSIFGKQVEGTNISKDIISSVLPYLYLYGFKSKILYEGNYNITDKVDIIIGNHISTIDFIIYLSIIRLFDHRPFYFILKKSIILIPGAGFIIGLGKDIKLNRKFEDDIDNLNKSISAIKEGVLILLPEGTRFTQEKLKKSQDFSRENNLTVFNNILFPKMKGLFTILNILKSNNRLGNIIDFTIQIQNFIKVQIYTKEIFKKEFGDTYCIINSYTVPDILLDKYDDFKKWFISKIWEKKDLLLDNIQNITDYNYKELKPNMKGYEYFILIICITLYFYLGCHSNGLFIPISMIYSYYLINSIYKKI
jgi:1-acyl-sn-glycerol-3-phosphate acyltransferase